MLVTVSEQCDQKIMALRDEEKKGIIHAVTWCHIFYTFIDIIGSNSGIVSHKKVKFWNQMQGYVSLLYPCLLTTDCSLQEYCMTNLFITV